MSSRKTLEHSSNVLSFDSYFRQEWKRNHFESIQMENLLIQEEEQLNPVPIVPRHWCPFQRHRLQVALVGGIVSSPSFPSIVTIGGKVVEVCLWTSSP